MKQATLDYTRTPPGQDTSLAEEARRRYLSYALSVITSRALPDARDGLKPVQRRILHAMWHNLHLTSDAKPRKSAKVVGEVLGNYHPHGDQATYEAMVRLAQPWTMRYPLVEGFGNFGSVDGDSPAAMRYTEVRLTPLARELLGEIGRDTVDFRDNYDGTSREPTVLPARFPHLLVNGSAGIAVGMATNIPPHNLGEVVAAACALIEKSGTSLRSLLKHIEGPDFPTGGVIAASREEVQEVYRKGQGTLRVRGTTEVQKGKRGRRYLVITSVPYGTNKSDLVARIGALIGARKVPQLVDVRDESTTDVRIVCELRPGADDAAADAAVAYLHKHTPLSTTFAVNLTALVPGDKPGTLRPARLDLKEYLQGFLEFRRATVTRRFRYDLARLEERIHILEGFAIVFAHLDTVLRIVRKAKARKDAAQKLMARFRLDAVQTDAILDTRIYRLAQLEIKKILDELAEKKKEARKIRSILKSRQKLWGVVKKELQEVARTHGDPRRTTIGGATVQEEVQFDPEAYIVAEDVYAILTRDGWVKRQASVRSVDNIRVREGDEVMAVTLGSTLSMVVFFSSLGTAFTCRIHDLPQTTGHGQPIQKIFKLRDGERIVSMLGLDPRAPLPAPARRKAKEDPEPPYLFTMARGGRGFRFAVAPYREESTRAGRRFARVRAGDEILGVVPAEGHETVISASRNGRLLLFQVGEANLLSGPGLGVICHKVGKGDHVVGFGLAATEKDGVQVVTERGASAWIRPQKEGLGRRAGKGRVYRKKEKLAEVTGPPLTVPTFPRRGRS